MDLRAQIDQLYPEINNSQDKCQETVNLDLIAKLKEVENERDALSDKIAIYQERLKALNKLGRQYANLIKAAEALEEQKPETKDIGVKA